MFIIISTRLKRPHFHLRAIILTGPEDYNTNCVYGFSIILFFHKQEVKYYYRNYSLVESLYKMYTTIK